jgi:V/A-type H+/Na+-transporting ATPase subunit D
MLTRVSPTRMKLLETKKRHIIAFRGHKLLKEKLEALVRELINLTKEFEKQEKLVSSKLPEIFKNFLQFRANYTDEDIEKIFSCFSTQLDIEMSERNVMNILLPQFKITTKEIIKINTYDKGISPLFDIILIQFNEVIKEILKLAEIESSIYALAETVSLTRRRVNALEYVLIPELSKTIKDITSKLEEYERSNLVRLMKIKDILSSKS